jgi:hypothetical protein
VGQAGGPLCPSARADLPGGVLFGVVGGGLRDTGGLVGYLRAPQPVTDEVLALAGPLKPTTVFRFASACAASTCAHFDGTDCSLATRVVDLLPAVVDVLPPCPIRRDCRWWAQEGKAACMRCPAIATDPADASEALRRAADPAEPVQPRS